jgi:hypothetical protein
VSNLKILRVIEKSLPFNTKSGYVVTSSFWRERLMAYPIIGKFCPHKRDRSCSVNFLWIHLAEICALKERYRLENVSKWVHIVGWAGFLGWFY